MLEPMLQSKVLLHSKTGVHSLIRLKIINACLYSCNFLLNAQKIAGRAAGFKILVFHQFVNV